MASANKPSTLGRTKKSISVIPEADSTYADSATALAVLEAIQSTLKSTSNVGFRKMARFLGK